MFLNNRYHDPTTQQFISVDPLVTSTHEPYIYGSANPVTYSDPSGLCTSFSMSADGGWECDFHNTDRPTRVCNAIARCGEPRPAVPVVGVEVGTFEDLVVDDGSGGHVPLRDHPGIDAATAAEMAGDASTGAFIEFGDGRFKAWTDPSHPWYGQVRYYPLRAGAERSARNLILGSSGAVASDRLTWARRGGKALAVVGVAFDLHDGWELYDDHGPAVRAVGAGGRSAASLGGAVGGAYAGGKAGAAVGVFACSPALAWVCGPIGGGVGAAGGGVAGSRAGQWLWDMTIGRAF